VPRPCLRLADGVGLLAGFRGILRQFHPEAGTGCGVGFDGRHTYQFRNQKKAAHGVTAAPQYVSACRTVLGPTMHRAAPEVSVLLK
jgi:hypothetical protein